MGVVSAKNVCVIDPANCKAGSATAVDTDITGDSICPVGDCDDGYTEGVASTAGTCIKC